MRALYDHGSAVTPANPYAHHAKNRNKGPALLDHDPCEYPGESGLTQAEMLEMDVSRLEKRIRELESTNDPFNVRLQRPSCSRAPSLKRIIMIMKEAPRTIFMKEMSRPKDSLTVLLEVCSNSVQKNPYLRVSLVM